MVQYGIQYDLKWSKLYLKNHSNGSGITMYPSLVSKYMQTVDSSPPIRKHHRFPLSNFQKNILNMVGLPKKISCPQCNFTCMSNKILNNHKASKHPRTPMPRKMVPKKILRNLRKPRKPRFPQKGRPMQQPLIILWKLLPRKL